MTTRREFSASRFKAGLKLLLANPELRDALGIKDPSRTPNSPDKLCQLVRHRFANKSFPAGATFHCGQEGTANVGVFFLPSGWRGGFRNEGRLTSPGPCLFFFWLAQVHKVQGRQPEHFYVSAEGFLRLPS